MKKLHKLILLSYLGPLVLTFFIALFILLMQFLWKYVDDLVGKGLEWYIILELLFFASASLVPMALPLAILLSSIMTFGNLGEHSELTACKSSGISLQKVMRPLVILSIGMSALAFYFSNYVLPIANLKFGALLYDIREQRPAFALREGIFYNGLEGYIIKVGKVDKDGQKLYNIMIYDHTQNLGNTKLIVAKSGSMSMSSDNAMVLSLQDGNSYEEVQDNNKREHQPFQRSEFKSLTKRFDMSAYKFSRSDEELFKDNYQMLNLTQLSQMEDTVIQENIDVAKKYLIQSRQSLFAGPEQESFATLRPPVGNAFQKRKPVEVSKVQLKARVLDNFDKSERAKILDQAVVLVRNAKQIAYNQTEDMDYRKKSLVKYQIEWHRKFTLSIACLILFFIGAPLGAIIRKGGLGMPVFMSTVFFVFYHMMSITGEKFAKEMVITPVVGMWLASLVLLPIGLFLTLKATSDSALFDVNAYISVLKRPFIRKKK